LAVLQVQTKAALLLQTNEEYDKEDEKDTRHNGQILFLHTREFKKAKLNNILIPKFFFRSCMSAIKKTAAFTMQQRPVTCIQHSTSSKTQQYGCMESTRKLK